MSAHARFGWHRRSSPGPGGDLPGEVQSLSIAATSWARPSSRWAPPTLDLQYIGISGQAALNASTGPRQTSGLLRVVSGQPSREEPLVQCREEGHKIRQHRFAVSLDDFHAAEAASRHWRLDPHLEGRTGSRSILVLPSDMPLVHRRGCRLPARSPANIQPSPRDHASVASSVARPSRDSHSQNSSISRRLVLAGEAFAK